MAWILDLRVVTLLAVAVMIPGCKKQESQAVTGSSQIGVASWYGKPFDGRLTASGDIFDMQKLTAAHRTYAFGTILRITNQSNGQFVEVRVNDRGPFVKNRLIDLSFAAAQKISMPGIATVALDVVRAPRTRAILHYGVQTGSFAQKSDAEALSLQMRNQFGKARVIFRQRDQTWRVLVGDLPGEQEASRVEEQVEKQAGTSFVVLLDDND